MTATAQQLPIILNADTSYMPDTLSGAVYGAGTWHAGGWAYDFDGVDDYIEVNDGMLVASTGIASEEGNITGLTLSADGIYLYILGDVSDQVRQYTLSTPWDITTKSLTRSASITTEDLLPASLRFSVDGLYMYMLWDTWNDISYYSLGTAWDISTLTHLGQFAVWNGETAPSGLFIRADGLKFYVVWSTNDTVYQYSMSIAWDMATASYDGISLSVTAQETVPSGLAFKDDGTELYLLGTTGDDITVYTLSTAWNVSTWTASWIVFYVGSQDTAPTDIYFWDNGKKLYIAGWTTDTVYCYHLYSAYSFSNPSYANGFTIVGWISPDTDGEANLGTVISKTLWGIAECWYYYAVNANTMRMRIANRTWTWTNRASAAASITYWVWTHVAVTVDSTGLVTHYINSVQSGAPWVSATPNNIITILPTRIWNRSSGTDRSYDGKQWNLYRFSYPLSQEEITYMYNNY